MTKRGAEAIAADKWTHELHQIPRRREDGEFYTRMVLRESLILPL
ncbi:MAG TPA: hypothetical protein VF515_12400 [Candidatus Binatia bacterium]|jgi:hypothetical protein